jgi:hypothetical protein
VLVLGVHAYLRRAGVDRAVLRFATGLGAFLIATVVVAVYIRVGEPTALPNIPALGYLWRFGILAAIGAIVNAVAALIG